MDLIDLKIRASDRFVECGIEQMRAEREEAWIEHALLGVEMKVLNVAASVIEFARRFKKEQG